METPVKIFSCTQSENLSEKIAQVFGQSLGKVEFQRYSDGEFQPSFEESVRGSRVFLIGSTNPPSDNLMEMLLMLDAAKRASARHITAVIPYFGWARQDRKDKPRVPIGAKLIAKLIESAGATRIITMDLHADQIQGFFEKPVDHLYASAIFVPYIQSLKIDNLTRHPSQIYEAFFEGIILFILMNFVFNKYLYKSPGLISSLFLIFYSIFRFLIEFTREPDLHLGFIFLNLTQGQIISILFFMAGLILFYRKNA